MNERDLDRELERLGAASEGLRAGAGFNEKVVLAALASAASSQLDLGRALRRVVPFAVLAAALSVFWAVISEHSTDDAFAAADDTVELEW